MKGLNFVSGINSWLAQRQPRERIIVVVGAGIVFLAAVYLALLPSLERSTELQERHRILQADLQWLSEQSASVSRLSNSCVDKTIKKGAAKDVINRLIRRNQIKLVKFAEQAQGKYALYLESANANRLLQLAHQLACQGLKTNLLDVRRPDAAATNYVVRMEVQHVN
ncbi:type II secretion system protein M [SAR92 clade bacterium H455]|uniref:Type II secretion system protein M n=1 Tax=SAR92 clade bacterium H455 TaxID=2974818 RepID=A0ABY5TQL6_9GAMM|nr:type II secretion system protein M [SAR92 clade bacterium H455]